MAQPLLTATLLVVAGAVTTDMVREVVKGSLRGVRAWSFAALGAVVAPAALFAPLWALSTEPLVSLEVASVGQQFTLPSSSGSLVLRGHGTLTDDGPDTATVELDGFEEQVRGVLRRPHGHARGRKLAVPSGTESTVTLRLDVDGRARTVIASKLTGHVAGPLRLDIFALPMPRYMLLAALFAALVLASWVHARVRLRRLGYWASVLFAFGAMGVYGAAPKPTFAAIAGAASLSLVAGALIGSITVRAMGWVVRRSALRPTSGKRARPFKS